jgi:hypothetical protein
MHKTVLMYVFLQLLKAAFCSKSYQGRVMENIQYKEPALDYSLLSAPISYALLLKTHDIEHNEQRHRGGKRGGKRCRYCKHCKRFKRCISLHARHTQRKARQQALQARLQALLQARDKRACGHAASSTAS